MELIRISSRKLKIMLTPTDMSHFELNSDSIGEDSVKTHRAFRMLLAELKDQVGFDTDDRHLSVQYFPSREGGCEMFISNLAESDETEEGDPLTKQPSKTALQPRNGRKQNDCFRRDFAYRFQSLSDLMTVCHRLDTIDYICESAAYRDECRQYYLFLSTLSSSPFSMPDEIGFIVEYGNIENAAVRRLYLREHGTPICEANAIACLSALQ